MEQPITREEVRARLKAVIKIFPIIRLSQLTNIIRSDLRRFIEGKPARRYAGIGPMRLKKLHKLCIEIETGVWRWNGKRIGSKIWRDEAIRPPSVIHRVMFDGVKPALLTGQQRNNDTMPSFAQLFATKTGALLPKSFKASK